MKRALSLSGAPVSPGIAMGRAVLWLSRHDTAPRRALEAEEVAGELDRLTRAVSASVVEIQATAEQVESRLGPEYAAIFRAHGLFLQDRAFVAPIEKRIREDLLNAEWAVESTTSALVARFRDLPDEYLAQRAADITDVSRVLLSHLGDATETGARIEELAGEDLVLIADELTPSDAVRIPRDRVVGFATEKGGKTSHAAIIARSFGLPAVVAVNRLLASVGDGDHVIIDGRDGIIWREASESVRELFRERRDEENRRERSLRERAITTTARTTDGVDLEIRANIELAGEVGDVLTYGGDGVGLFRSEFLYLSTGSEEFPGEDEQTRLYSQVLAKLAPMPVVIRTYDLGGKKGARQLVGTDEINPVLGLRGVRLCFKRKEMFRTQLLALLRSAASGNLRILVPMVSGVEEMRQVRALLEEAKEELRERGLEIADHIPLGAMIEVPSAAVTADLIAPEVDFMALGTNDLIQYTLAVDRANEMVSELFRPQHPAVLRLLKMVADAARAAGKPLSVCGEMAADPTMLFVLIGLGIREFSMGPRTIPVAKDFARAISAHEAARVARAALSLATPDEVSAFLSQEVRARTGASTLS